MLGRKILTLLEVSQEAKLPLLVSRVILLFLSIFTKSHASSPFEALNSVQLSKSQMDVRPSVQKKLRTMVFSMVSTEDSDIPSSCEMKNEPAFKALQGQPSFFWFRASRCSLYLRQKTQSRSHIPISERRLLLWCLWEASLPLQSKTGNHSHPHTIWGARKFPQAALMKLMILYTWDGFLRESLEFPKGSQATCSVWWGSRDGYGANGRVIGLIWIWFEAHWFILRSWGDISVLLFLWHCCWGLSRVQSSKSRLLMCLIGKTQLLCMQFRGIGQHLVARGKSHGFSRVAQAPGVYSRVTTGMPMLNGSLFSQDTCLGMTDTAGS